MFGILNPPILHVNNCVWKLHVTHVYAHCPPPTSKKVTKKPTINHIGSTNKPPIILVTSVICCITDFLFTHQTGNLLVIITVFRYMNRDNVINLFIVNLSIGDILVIGFAMPFRVSNVADAFYIFYQMKPIKLM